MHFQCICLYMIVLTHENSLQNCWTWSLTTSDGVSIITVHLGGSYTGLFRSHMLCDHRPFLVALLLKLLCYVCVISLILESDQYVLFNFSCGNVLGHGVLRVSIKLLKKKLSGHDNLKTFLKLSHCVGRRENGFFTCSEAKGIRRPMLTRVASQKKHDLSLVEALPFNYRSSPSILASGGLMSTNY